MEKFRNYLIIIDFQFVNCQLTENGTIGKFTNLEMTDLIYERRVSELLICKIVDRTNFEMTDIIYIRRVS